MRNCNPAEQRNHFGLTTAARLFQHPAHLSADGVRGGTAIKEV
jgi:hypothetical protein